MQFEGQLSGSLGLVYSATVGSVIAMGYNITDWTGYIDLMQEMRSIVRIPDHGLIAGDLQSENGLGSYLSIQSPGETVTFRVELNAKTLGVHKFNVTAFDGFACTASANGCAWHATTTLSTTISGTTPAPITNLSATLGSNGATLSWSAATGAVKYQIHSSDLSGSSTTFVNIAETTSTNYLDASILASFNTSSLDGYKAYFVRAVNTNSIASISNFKVISKASAPVKKGGGRRR